MRMAVPYEEASSIRPPPPAPSNKWGPYSGAGDFSANMVVILIVLFCVLFLALALNAILRYLLCPNRRTRRASDPEKPSPDAPPAPPADSAPAHQLFTAGAKLAGTDQADCAICLLVFADGDRVRVLPACGHGFHAACVERWLGTKGSCPTCRAVCRADAGPAPAVSSSA